MLLPGTPAPPFTLPDQDGVPRSLSDLAGSWVLLWWYPKASTPGWTLEGRALRDRAAEFAAAGCVIVGISFDSPAENKAFADAQHFGFRLLSDEERSASRAYHAVRPSGDQYETFPLRVSYLVDPAGVIRKGYVVADVKGHAGDVLADLALLRAGR